MQVGCRSASWYADDLLDNFARPSVREIVPELQHLEVGQWLPMTLTPSAKRSFVVEGFDRPWWTPIHTWAWQLVPLAADGPTRLITRLHTFYNWRRPATLRTVSLMELGHFAMMRRMLRGIRDRAGAEHRGQWAWPTTRSD